MLTDSAGCEMPRASAAFWKDPALAFLRAQGIALSREEENDEELNRAPLSVDGLQKWSIKQSIFEEAAY